MSYKVFISHSMSVDDLELIHQISKEAKLNDISTYIAERDIKPGHPLSNKIEFAIKDCDCVLIFLTKGGAKSPWVQQEIGYARAMNKLRVPIVEDGVNLSGFDIGNEYIRLNRNDPYNTVTKAISYLRELKLKKEENEMLGWLIVGGLGLLGLSAMAALSKNNDNEEDR